MKKLRTLIDTALTAHHNVFNLECHNLPALREDLLHYHQFTSRACYHWHPNSNGLYRMDMTHIVVPNTASFESALKHLCNRPHFAIYLFEGIRDEFKIVSTWPLLRQLVANRSSQRKLLLFAGAGLNLPEHMRDMFIEACVYPKPAEPVHAPRVA